MTDLQLALVAVGGWLVLLATATWCLYRLGRFHR